MASTVKCLFAVSNKRFFEISIRYWFIKSLKFKPVSSFIILEILFEFVSKYVAKSFSEADCKR